MVLLKEIIEFIFSLALFINALLFIPQILKIYQEKTTSGISIITFLGFLLIQFTIVLHGIIKHDPILIFGYLLSMLTCGTVVILIITYRNKNHIANQISLEEIIAQLPEHIYWKDKNYVATGSNTNNWKDFGFKSYDEYKGKTDYDMFPKEQADHIRAIDEEVMRTGQMKIIEEPAKKADGSDTLYLSHKIPLKNKRNAVIGILGISIDITHAKQKMEERLNMLEDIIAMMPGTVYWMDKNGVYLGCNDNEAKIIGLSSRKDIVGKRNIDIPGFLIPEALDPVNKEVMEQKKAILLEEPALLQDGTSATFLSNKRPLYNKHGEVIGMVGISFDITDRKEKERLELENTIHKQLLQEQERFTKIANQVAHDIRSPVASLLMLVKSCQEIPETERVALREAAMTVGDIANNLLNKYQKPESKTETEERQPILISAMLLQLLTDKKYQYQELPVKFDHNFSQKGNFAFIKIEPTALKRAISNIINNAVDSFDKKEGIVNIKLDATKEWVKITVEDNGKGMPEEIVEKILKNIAVTQGKENGHGLGLSQVRETLADNQGELSITSKPGKGSKITLTFPRIKTPSWIAEEIKLSPQDTVVIVDDDKSIHTAWDVHFANILNKTPTIKLKHFEIGKEALNFINNSSDADKQKIFLLTDYELLKQDLNGLQIVAQSHINRSVLVTSHYVNQEVQEQAAKTGTKILPKQLASEVPINIDASIKYENLDATKKIDIVIVDDDQNFADILVNITFEGLNVDHYTNPENFLQHAAKYPKDTKICLDKNFTGGQMNGVALAEILHLQGFTRLFMISGEAFAFGSLPNYLTIIDKVEVEKIKDL